MKKTLIGIAAMGCMLFAGQQASAGTLNDAISNYTGSLVFNITMGFDVSDKETKGIVNVTSVNGFDGLSTIQLWAQTSTDAVYGLFYGLTNQYVSGTSPDVTLGLKGGNFSYYETNTRLNLLYGKAGLNATGTDYSDGVHSVLGSNMFTQALFSGKFDTGIFPTDPLVTVIQHVTSATSPATGDGAAIGSVEGGLLYTKLESDYYKNTNDFYLNITVQDPLDPSLALPATDWSQYVVGALHASAVPEPATMLLFGAGLLGIASIRRKLSK